MKVGFDLDGVLCDIGVVELHLMHKLPPKGEETAELYYYTERKPLLNPKLLMHEDDEYHIVTSRHQGLREVTGRWVEKYYPDVNSLNIVGVEAWYQNASGADDPAVWKAYANQVVKLKAAKINELELDVFFDDSVGNVVQLRELCPNTTIIQYGGRLR